MSPQVRRESPTLDGDASFDPVLGAAHDALAAARFPGPDYYEVLGWLHEELRPASYVEIGVLYGESLRLASPPMIAVGIDPSPKAQHQWRAPTHIFAVGSSEFFANYDLRDVIGMPCCSLAFVDGWHLFEQVVEDLSHLARYAESASVIVVHDTIPLNQETAARRRTTRFYTGDVWKVLPFLQQKACDMITVRTGPAGLTLIRGLSPASADLFTSAAEFAALPWDYFKDHEREFLQTIPNERAAVTAWLRQSGDSAAAARI